jgi:Uma2 family endonuclease
VTSTPAHDLPGRTPRLHPCSVWIWEALSIAAGVVREAGSFSTNPSFISPDLSGWLRTRLPAVPPTPFFELAPDWACEVVSPGSERIDRERKLPIYGRERVSHVWLVNPLERMVEVFRLDGDGYRLVVTRGGTDRVRLEPFGAIEIELEALWPTPMAEPK